MKLLSFPHAAYKVTKSNAVLFNAVPSSSPITLTGSAPTIPYRCRVKVLASGTHADCSGSVIVGSDTLSFTTSGQTKICTTNITASTLPIVSYTGIDCLVLIECLDTGGQEIKTETATSIQIRYEPTTKNYQGPDGQWTQSQSYAMVVDSTISVGSVIRYNTIDYQVKQVEAFSWLDGTEIYRILYF